MGAIVVAMVVGLVAIGLVVALVIFSALALAGLKAVNAAHESRSWFVNRRRRS
ncbi:hypothetical protein MOQ72_07055 [Saccharopolyspora sp. K220]|uniref:hypothetical protein n=1 Tax=Saccharopolyspora soli TaxID=2926618 RepID=UPI001F579D4C|nr:hypothetical protein [Saccharopolyspora soli]MCI2417175.1 hypothetical protein [Saccharopolyspora soli]